jgi:hypothetical protein
LLHCHADTVSVQIDARATTIRVVVEPHQRTCVEQLEATDASNEMEKAMRRWIIAVVAATAVTVPAAAQNQTQGQSQQRQASQQTSSQQLPEIIASDLRPDQIRELQEALNMKGFDAGDEDGIWGPETQDAVREFQEAQGMDVTGQPSRQTIYALGFKSVGDEGTSGTADATVGSGAGSQSSQGQDGDAQGGAKMNPQDVQQGAGHQSGQGQTNK